MGLCRTCGKDWSMTEGEHKYYQDMIEKRKNAGQDFSMPTHCVSCRQAKKTQIISPVRIIEKLEVMTRKAQNNEYTMNEEKLVKELQIVTGLLKKFVNYSNTGKLNESQPTPS